MRLPLLAPLAPDRPFDVIALGLNSLDIVAVIPHHPVAGGKTRIERLATLPGGQSASAAVGCARLGWKTQYIGAFGDDDAARIGIESLERDQVDTSLVRRVRGATSHTSLVLVDARSGDRTVIWHRDPRLAMSADGRPRRRDRPRTRAARRRSRTAGRDRGRARGERGRRAHGHRRREAAPRHRGTAAAHRHHHCRRGVSVRAHGAAGSRRRASRDGPPVRAGAHLRDARTEGQPVAGGRQGSAHAGVRRARRGHDRRRRRVPRPASSPDG